jgi:hypothetical protein
MSKFNTRPFLLSTLGIRMTSKTEGSSYNRGMSEKPLVGVVMGSKSDAETLAPALEILEEFGLRMRREWSRRIARQIGFLNMQRRRLGAA